MHLQAYGAADNGRHSTWENGSVFERYYKTEDLYFRSVLFRYGSTIRQCPVSIIDDLLTDIVNEKVAKSLFNQAFLENDFVLEI